MYHNVISGVKALGLLIVTAIALVSPLEGQRAGAEIWGANCGRCHLIQPTNRYDAKAWEDIGATHVAAMTSRGGLMSPNQHIDAIRRFKEAID